MLVVFVGSIGGIAGLRGGSASFEYMAAPAVEAAAAVADWVTTLLPKETPAVKV
jgi:hypothetical protein